MSGPGSGRAVRSRAMISIRERPASVEYRAVPGHWEGDLIAGSRNTYIATLVERHSRYVMLAKVPNKKTETVVNALIERMRETAASGVYQWEVARRGRAVEELGRTRREIAACRVQIPAAPDRAHRRFGDLPEAIRLSEGELRMAFSGAEDLAAKLVDLSQAMPHDWNGFMRTVEE